MHREPKKDHTLSEKAQQKIKPLPNNKLPLPFEEREKLPLLKNMPGGSTTVEVVDKMENGAEECI